MMMAASIYAHTFMHPFAEATELTTDPLVTNVSWRGKISVQIKVSVELRAVPSL